MEPETPEIQPAGVGPVLGADGAPVTFDWNGRTWRLEHPVQKAKDELEKLVLRYVVGQQEEMRGVWAEDTFAAKEKELDDRIYGGHHKTLGSLWQAVTSGPDGNALFLLALLRQHQPHATLAEAATMWNASPRSLRLAYAEVIPDFFSVLVASRAGDPAEKARAAAAGAAQIVALLGVPGAPATPSS